MKPISRNLPKLLLFVVCFLTPFPLDVAYGQRGNRRAVVNDPLSKATQAFFSLVIYHRDECYWSNRRDVSRTENRILITYRMKWKPYGNVNIEFEEGRFSGAFLRVPFNNKNQVMMDAVKSMLGGRLEISRTKSDSPSWYLDSNVANILGVNILSSDELNFINDPEDNSPNTTFGIVQQRSAYVE